MLHRLALPFKPSVSGGSSPLFVPTKESGPYLSTYMYVDIYRYIVYIYTYLVVFDRFALPFQSSVSGSSSPLFVLVVGPVLLHKLVVVVDHRLEPTPANNVANL